MSYLNTNRLRQTSVDEEGALPKKLSPTSAASCESTNGRQSAQSQFIRSGSSENVFARRAAAETRRPTNVTPDNAGPLRRRDVIRFQMNIHFGPVNAALVSYVGHIKS